MILEQPIVKSSRYGLNSYGYEGIKLWNRLKNEMKCEVDLKQFKLLLSTWNGIPCMCSSCHLCVLSQM